MPPSGSLDNTLGAIFVGLVISTALYGITCSQAYLYYTENSNRDGRFLKAFVGFVMILDTASAITLAILLYHYLITKYGDLSSLASVHWSLPTESVTATLLISCVQWFYAWRVYHISKKQYLAPAIIALFSAARLVLIAVVYSIKLLEIGTLASDFLGMHLAVPAFALDSVADTLIAASMVFHLIKNRTAIRRTNKVIRLLAIYAVSTGLTTIVCASAALITLLASPATFIWFPCYLVLVRMYSCSMLCVLNNRNYVLREMNGTDGVITLSVLSQQNSSPGTTRTYAPSGNHPGIVSRDDDIILESEQDAFESKAVV